MSFSRGRLMRAQASHPLAAPEPIAPDPGEADPVETATPAGRRSSISVTGLLQRNALLLVMALLVVTFSALRPSTFFTVGNLTTTLGIQAPAGLLVLGVTVVLLVGEFDLSIAATMGFSASVVADLTTRHGISPLLACLIVLGCSLLVGLLNAFFIVRVGVHSFIVTLGVGTLVEGLGIGLVGATTIGGLPSSFTGIFQDQTAGIQRAFFYTLAIGIVFYLVVARMPLGRSLFFTGNARTAASLAGIRTDRLRVGAMVVAALIAGCGGIMLAGQTAAASPTIADPYLLPAYAAAFLGATAFTPGRFNVWGSLWAVYLLAVGTTGFQLLGFQSWVIDFFNGTVLVLAVAFAKIFGTQRTRRGRPRTTDDNGRRPSPEEGA